MRDVVSCFFVSALYACAAILIGVSSARAQEEEESLPPIRTIVSLGRPYAAMPLIATPETAPPVQTSYEGLPISKTVPRKNEFHTIDPTVDIAGYSYIFDVKGLEAEYEVASSMGLIKLTHELAVIEELKKIHKGKEFAEGVTDTVKGIGTGVVSLVKSPGKSIKDMGTRLRRTGRSIERAVTQEKIGEDARGQDRSYLGSGPAGQARRTLAYQFGVDVYTGNPVLQRLLTELSHAKFAGRIATWVLPITISALGHFNPLAGDEQTERLICENTPDEVRRQVGVELEPALRMHREDKAQPLYRFLMNPNYSPRDIAYVGAAVRGMYSVSMLPNVIDELSGAESPDQAEMLALWARLFGLLNDNIERLTGFARYGALLAGFGESGTMYVMFPGDVLGKWEEVRRSFGMLLADREKRGMKGVEVWALGDVDPDLWSELEERGVVVRQHILLDERFFNRTNPFIGQDPAQ